MSRSTGWSGGDASPAAMQPLSWCRSGRCWPKTTPRSRSSWRADCGKPVSPSTGVPTATPASSPRTTLSSMAMGKRRRREQQTSMWVATSDLPRSAAHPFYVHATMHRLVVARCRDVRREHDLFPVPWDPSLPGSGVARPVGRCCDLACPGHRGPPRARMRHPRHLQRHDHRSNRREQALTAR